MKHIRPDHVLAAKHPGVTIIADLQHLSLDVVSMMSEKVLDVVTINAQAPVEAEDAADRRETTQSAPAYQTGPSPPIQNRPVHRRWHNPSDGLLQLLRNQ